MNRWIASPPPALELAAALAQIEIIRRDIRDLRELLADRRLERARIAFNYELAALRFKAALLRHAEYWGKAGFRQDQPRWPKGSGEISGRWSGGAGTASGGGVIAVAGPTRGGHHFVPRKVFEKEPLRPETWKVFDQSVTGPLNAGHHKTSREHDIYNDAVRDHYNRFLRENGIRSEDMTPDQARRLVDEVKRSSDPRVRGFNMRIYMREIIYWLRRTPRGSE
jgi:hypothetical protein